MTSDRPGAANSGDFAEFRIDPRELFGPDELAADPGVPDISAAEATWLQAMLSADVAQPPPPSTTVDDIVAAARAAHSGVGGQQLPQAGSGQQWQPPTQQFPVAAQGGWADQPVDELAARRRRKLRNGLLAAACVAVIAIAVPVAVNMSGSSGGADSSLPSGAAAAGPSDQASAASSSGPDAAAPNAAAPNTAADNPAAPNTAADAGSVAAGSTLQEDSNPAAAASGAAGAESNVATGAAAPGAAVPSRAAGQSTSQQSVAGSAAAAPSQPASQESAAASSAAASAASSAGEACQWLPLPSSADVLATQAFGAGVVGPVAPISTECRDTRVAGGVFPAADGSRNGVRVEVAQAADGACAAQGCRPDSDGTLTATVDDSTVVWVYLDGNEARVSASTGLNVSAVRLAEFGSALLQQIG